MVNPHRAIAASPALKKVADLGPQEAHQRRNLDLEWQTECYQLSRDVGEAGYVMHLTANTLAMCSFQPKELTDDDEHVDPENPAVRRVMRCLVGPRGGQKELKRKLALAAGTAGEWHLIASETQGNKNYGLLWEALSVREFRHTSAGKVQRSRDGASWADVPGSTYTARGWVGDGEFSDRADSSMRRALSAAREVAAHGQVIEAASKSRVAAGILFIPDEMTFGGDDDDLTDDEALDAFTELLLKHLSAPIKDRTSAASYVPLVLRGKAEHGEKIKLINLGRDLDKNAVEMRAAALSRLATMLDVPPELIEGKGGLNHWTGYNVDAEFITKHVTPLGELLADFLTVAYLRPMLEEYEGMTPEESAKYVLVFDTEDVSGQADEEGSFRALHDRDLASDLALVRKSGGDESDMPDDEELRIRRTLRLVERRPELAPILLPRVPGFEGLDWSSLAAPAPTGGAPGAPTGEANPAEVGPPAPSTEELIVRLTTAADAALERAVERAAARALTAARKDPVLRDRAVAADYLTMFTVIGPSDVARLHLDLNDLFADAWDRYSARSRTWMRDWAISRGMGATEADDVATLATGELCERLTGWMLGNLHHGYSTGPNGLRIPDSLVEDCLRLVAGAATR